MSETKLLRLRRAIGEVERITTDEFGRSCTGCGAFAEDYDKDPSCDPNCPWGRIDDLLDTLTNGDS